MLKAYKYRIYPSTEQVAKIEQHFGACRLVWNLALAVKKYAYENNRINITRYDLQRQLVDLKHGYDWLYNINSQSLQGVLLNLDNAYKSFFNGAGFPKFRKKTNRQSFQCPQRVTIENDEIKLPIIGGVKFDNNRLVSGKIKTATVSKSPTNKYFISLLIDDNKEIPKSPQIDAKNTIGLDLGIKSFVVTSAGSYYKPNLFLKKSLDRLAHIQNRASRKKRGSKNRKKANLCVAKLHERITNQRVDYIHKITSELIRDSQADSFVIEDLAIANMLLSRKISRSIQDSSWGEFVRQMKYKCKWYGKNLIIIDRFAPSSKRCSECGKINEELTLADREWACQCGANHDRDLNAAKNIKFFGLNTPVGSREEPVESRPKGRTKKQERYL